MCRLLFRFGGFLPRGESSCVLDRGQSTTRRTSRNTKSRWAMVQERRHHLYFAEGRLTLSKVTQGCSVARTASGSTFCIAFEALFCRCRLSPSPSGNKECFLQLYTFWGIFTFMLRFIDLLVMGVIRAGCTCSSALLIFFIIILDTNSALWLGWQ